MQSAWLRLLMTQLNWLNISHCVVGSGGLQWLKYFTRICLRSGGGTHQAVETRSVEKPRGISGKGARPARPRESTAVHPLVTRRREQWRRRKLIILQVPRLLDAARARRERRKRERENESSFCEGTRMSARWEVLSVTSQKIMPPTTPADYCWRHDFAGRNFAHVLPLKRDEPWCWKCISAGVRVI